jgi:hypothetical protein
MAASRVMSRSIRFFSVLAALVVSGCSKPKSEKTEATPSPHPPVDACSLLTSDEIQSVQGEALKQAKPSQTVAGYSFAAQCYYETTTNVNSVVISVGQRTRAAGEKDPREWWKQTFHREEGDNEEHERAGEREREEEGKRTPPKKVDGLGDEAFWVASPVGGSMYVLKGDVYIRVSTGGREQFERVKRLSELALRHM